MVKLESNWLDLRTLDELALQKTPIHQLGAGTKLGTTLAFIMVVASFSRYEVTGLIPCVFYPIVLITLGRLPYQLLLKRLLLVAPVILFIGLFNPLFDRVPVAAVGPLVVTGGWISFLSISVKLILTITAALILIATTGIHAICSTLYRLGVPQPLVVQILFMYRYIHVLLEEVLKTLQAYQLRSCHNSGIGYQAWGSLLGQLLLRTIARAQRIYQAMLCRGYDGHIILETTAARKKPDLLYFAGWLLFFSLCRLVNLPQWLGTFITGGLP